MTAHTAPVAGSEAKVFVAGDWHSNLSWMRTLIPRLKILEPSGRRILHVGDFNITSNRIGKGFLLAVDRACTEAGIDRVLVTPGNHDDWGRLGQRFQNNGSEAAQLSDVVWALPRGFRFTIGTTSFLSFGGAASLDFASKRVGRDWFMSEVASSEEVASSVAEGRTDVLLTHEALPGGARQIQAFLESGGGRGWSREALRRSAESRRLIAELWSGTTPSILFHGHMHLRGEGLLPNDQHVYALARDGQRGNAGVLDTLNRTWTWLD